MPCYVRGVALCRYAWMRKPRSGSPETSSCSLLSASSPRDGGAGCTVKDTMEDDDVMAFGEVATIDAVTVTAAATDGAELKSANSSSSSSASGCWSAAAAGMVAVAAASLSQSSELLSVVVLFRMVVTLALLLSNALPFSVVAGAAVAATAALFLVVRPCPWSRSAVVFVECGPAEVMVAELF